MQPWIETLKIEQFRALRNLEINRIGRVNLITGLNNSGKSSVLEAVRLLASGASPTVISEILRFREEDIEEQDNGESYFPFASLFHGFPGLTFDLNPIRIWSEKSGIKNLNVALSVGWYLEERDFDGSRKYVPVSQALFNISDGFPMLEIDRGDTKIPIPFDSGKFRFRGRHMRSDFANGVGLPCEFVSPYGGARTANLGQLWDKIALSDRESDVIQALQIIDQDIKAVSMVGGERPREHRTAIVRSKNLQVPVPLRSFGDGLNRLFGIILSLVNSKDGLLLIDEFENGLHHSVQSNIWRTIFKISRNLNIQVLATTHSWDAIETFQEVACEEQDEGVLIRLTRRGEEIIPTVFTEDELAIATRDKIEVR